MTRPSDDPGIAPDVGGQLLVTRAGSAVVSTDALLASADRLRALERLLGEYIRRVVMAEAVDGTTISDHLVGRIERPGFTEISDRVVPAAQRPVGQAAADVGLRIIGLEFDRLG